MSEREQNAGKDVELVGRVEDREGRLAVDLSCLTEDAYRMGNEG